MTGCAQPSQTVRWQLDGGLCGRLRAGVVVQLIAQPNDIPVPVGSLRKPFLYVDVNFVLAGIGKIREDAFTRTASGSALLCCRLW